MNESSNFYKWFNDISSKLGVREISFKKIFKYLDSPAIGNLTQNDNEPDEPWKILSSPSPLPAIGRKGFLVHKYASHVGAKLVFSHYQAAWNKFNK